MLKLNNYDIAHYEEWPTFLKVIVIILISTLFFCLSFLGIFAQKNEQIKLLKHKEQELKIRYSADQKKIKQTEALQQQTLKLQEGYSRKIERKIIQRQAVISEAISKLAKKNSLQVDAINFQKKYFVGAIKAHPILIDLRGNYAGFKNFLTEMSNCAQLVHFAFNRQQENNVINSKFIFYEKE